MSAILLTDDRDDIFCRKLSDGISKSYISDRIINNTETAGVLK